MNAVGMQECLMFCLLLVRQSTMMRAVREVIWRARKHLGETELTFDSLIKFVEGQLPKRSCNCICLTPSFYEKETNNLKAD